MITTRHFHPPPTWLPLRVLAGSMIAAAIPLLSQGAPLSDLADGALLSFLSVRCGVSLIVLVLALLMALSTGLAVGLLARRTGSWAEWLTGFLGRAVACIPVVAIAWAFVGGWIGRLGWPVETLMPEHFTGVETDLRAAYGSLLWAYLAPVLVLALPLCGEVAHFVVSDSTSTVDLDFSLRARGVPSGMRLYRHHLLQMLPLLRARLQSICLIAPVYLIVVEDVLHVTGWGGWMAAAIRDGDVNAISLGFISGGCIMALLGAGCHLLRGKVHPAAGILPTLAWNPWLLWVLGTLALPASFAYSWLIVWLAVLAAGSSAWHAAWMEVEERLPIDASLSLGASEIAIWRAHIAAPQFRMLGAWISSTLAQVLVWMTIACALQPRLIHEMDRRLAAVLRPLAIESAADAARTLADPTALLQVGGVIALASLFLLQLSRILRPRIP